ncbi:hypothetical protein EP073_05895 [Geovibrio thiophilus]|uniref:Uncharacterized protein n=1 Tax=Geovibrio thiophilus TaxID=139438 RepID=A0A3R5UUK8_9BACT|nr:oligosaccharide flippase family protein [Geovibrio thiophilus]QAR32955.1 hypothetical protein EP073_05895 [Geovibrio thiophilus]
MKSDAKRIFSNASSLFILQLITYAISLAAVPYLVRVLGPSKYGLVIFAQSVITYFIFLVDYGFDMWGTMRIAENQHDKKRLSEIFHNVMTAKLMLGGAGFLIILIFIASVGKFREEWRLILLSFGMIGGQILIPSWFYRGMERMKFIAVCLVAVKTGYLILVLLTVKTEADYVLVPLANFIAYSLAGLYGIWTVYAKFGLGFSLPVFSEVIKGIREGFIYFAKAITDNFAKITNTVLLGFIAGDAAVGFYGSAEKLMDAVRAMLSPVFQAIFPHSRRTAARSKHEWFIFIKKAGTAMAAFAAVLSASIFLLSDFGVRLVLGEEFMASVPVLRMLAVYLFFFSINNIMGVQTLVCFDRGKAFLSLTLAAKLLGLALSFLLIPAFFEKGAAFALVSAEAAYSLFLFIYIIKSGLLSDVRRSGK